jgi:hypothetical protein
MRLARVLSQSLSVNDSSTLNKGPQKVLMMARVRPLGTGKLLSLRSRHKAWNHLFLSIHILNFPDIQIVILFFFSGPRAR